MLGVVGFGVCLVFFFAYLLYSILVFNTLSLTIQKNTYTSFIITLQVSLFLFSPHLTAFLHPTYEISESLKWVNHLVKLFYKV